MTHHPRRARVRHHLRETFALHESHLSVWHGTKFALDTGVPALVGLLIGQPELGFIGALAGSLFSFSDLPAPLAQRTFRLLEMTAMMMLFGVLGFMLGAHSPLFWIILMVLVFSTGWLQLSTHIFTSPLRWGAISFISTAGLPSATWALAGMVLLGALVNAITQAVGAHFFPKAVAITQPAKETEPRSWRAKARFCFIYALTATVALIVGQARDLTHPMWITTTVLLVMQPDARSSLTRIIQRTTGTLLGVVAAAITVNFFHSAWGLFAAIIALSYALPYASIRNYWFQTALFAWLILVLYDFASVTHFNPHLIGERFLDVMLGCFLAFVGIVLTFAPLPRRHLKA